MIVFYVVYFIWFLSEVILNRARRSGETDKKNTDRNSLLVLWIVIVSSIMAGGVVAGSTSAPIFSDWRYSYMGLAIIVAGMILRFAAVKQLGRYFTVDVTIREGHKIMKEGFYHYVRHPSYTGSLLSFLGYGLSLNNYYGLIVVMIPVIISFRYRIGIEERALTGQFGTEYSDYMKATKRLIPFIY